MFVMLHAKLHVLVSNTVQDCFVAQMPSQFTSPGSNFYAIMDIEKKSSRFSFWVKIPNNHFQEMATKRLQLGFNSINIQWIQVLNIHFITIHKYLATCWIHGRRVMPMVFSLLLVCVFVLCSLLNCDNLNLKFSLHVKSTCGLSLLTCGIFGLNPHMCAQLFSHGAHIW